MQQHFLKSALVLALGLLAVGPAMAQRQMERLGRGMTAVRSNSTQIYVGWRLLGNDPPDITFNVYRSANGGAAVKINGSPLTTTTDYLDTPANLSTTAYSYSVKPVVGGVEVADAWAHPLNAAIALPANPTVRQYMPVPLQPTPDDAVTGVSYKIKFCWVGDLDGDGEYDFVVDRYNPTGEARQWLQAYKRDGTLLWQMNMGPNSIYQYNIEPGSSAISIGHGDNVTVYDMDGDGKSEVIVRTSDGVVFGDGATQTAGASDTVQFLSIVDGLTGGELARATVPNPRLGDGPMNGHMGILYLDGQRPSVVLAAKNRDSSNAFHGVITAWDWRNGILSQRWSWVDSGAVHAPEGHQIRIADVDNDGKDEFVDIGYVLDDNGTQLFNVGEIVHGDRFHLTDIDPDRPGLENFIIQQNNGSGLATALFDPGTGNMIRKWYASGVVDVGRGVVADMDANSKGCEFFSTQPGIFNAKGVQIYGSQPFPPETIWWDADLSREFVATVGSTAESPAISKFNPADSGNLSRIYTIYNETAPGVYQAYGGRPAFWGDIMGDWREEYLCVANDNSELRIYTPKTSSTTRIYTLMHNPQYRCQATTKGYVQSNYVDYYLGNGMTPPPPPPMVDATLAWRGGTGSTTWDSGVSSSWFRNGVSSQFANGDSVRFDIGGNSTTTVGLSGTLQPSAMTVYAPTSYSFDGAAGSLAGSMTLVKGGAGTMTLSGSHSFTGRTTVWDGALLLNGNLQQSPVTVWGGIWGGALSSGLKGGRIGGTGTFNQPVSLKYRAAITPGNGMANAGTLTFGAGLTAEDGSVLALDLSNDPTGLVTPSDRISVAGNLSLSGKVSVVIKSINGQLAPGTYTLLTYSGALTGGLANLQAIVPAGTPHTMTAGGGAITLTVPLTRAPAAIVWRGSGGTWDLASSQNWLRGGYPDVFVAGDTLTFDSTGSASPIATLIGALPVGGITVNSESDYTFSGGGSISGSGGITKSGGGTLTLQTLNDYTGPTTINGGVLAISTIGDAGSPGSIGAAGTAASNLVINGGTLRLTGPQTNTDRSLTLGAAGGIFDISLSGSAMQISGSVTGSGKLTKSGPGTLIFANPNTYSGGTLINGGTIYLADAATNSSGLGSGSVTLQNGTLSMSNVQGSETAAWNVIVPAGFTGRLNADGRCTLIGTLTGGGDFTFYTPYVRTELSGNWSAFTGRIFAIADTDGGDLRVKSSVGYPLALLDLGNKVYAYYNNTLAGNLTVPIGTLSGNATSVLMGSITAGRTLTWQVGARNEDSTFAGVIADNAGLTALTKTGTGTLVLTGASTHTGTTTVAAGRLRVDGSSAASNFTVQAGATLGGAGSITGNVTLQSGGGLEHGIAASTPLAITGNLTFAGTAVVRPVAGALPGIGTYTVLTYSGTLTGAPNLSWEAPPGTALTASFDTASPGIITMTLTLAPRSPGPIVWTGATDFNWGTTNNNWTAAGDSTSYQNGDTPWFTDSGLATSPVNIVANFEPAGVVVDSGKNYTFAGVGAITGAAFLTKSGTGVLTVSSAHAFTGSTTIHGGTVLISNAAALGTGTVTLSGGTWATGALAPLNPIVVTADSMISGGHSGGNHAVKNISGSGILTLNATSVFDLEGDMSGFSGTFVMTGSGSFRFYNVTNNASSSATFDLGTRGISARSGSAFNLGALAGQPGSTLGMASNSNSTGCTYTIGGNNADSTFAGVISNGGTTKLVGVVKTGAGSLTLAGANTYTGTTTVTSGKLVVTGSLAATATTVAATGALGGTGTIAGAVTCNGTLAPGNPVGTLTPSSGLTLSSTSILDCELGATSDLIAITGNLTLNGTVNVATAIPGIHTLITYTGTLTNNTLTVGTLPNGFTATVNTATAGQVRLIVSAANTAPQITSGPAAPLSNITTATTQLAVAATDDAGEGSLTYTWTSTGPSTVVFTPNGSNASKATVATFSAPGNYALTVTAADIPGLTDSASVEVAVIATPASVTISPSGATLPVGTGQTFTAGVLDQFGHAVSEPSIIWSASGSGGSINPSGVYSATAAGGPWLVSAAVGGLSSGVPVTVTQANATVTLANLSATYDGMPKQVTATTTPAGLNVLFSYSGSTIAPTVPGIYPVIATVDDPNYSGTSSDALVIASRTFAVWENEKFTPTQIAAGESALSADPDGDGLTNLAEYALGGQPYAFTPQPAVTSGPDSMAVTFQRPAHIGDVVYHAEAGVDFTSWQELTLEVLDPGSDPETVRATRTLSEPKPAQQFMRLRFVK